MLAYVFWHRPVDAATYDTAVAAFHRSLADHHPAGFVRSAARRIDRVPWADGGSHGRADLDHEDWYVLGGWDALGRLRDDALAGEHAVPHEDVASGSAAGTGGLYGLRHGDGSRLDGPSAVWFDKPAGTTYPAFDELLAPWVASAGVDVWMRELVLGPAPEYCALGPDGIALPAPLAGTAVRRTVLTA
jgi:hypothetical protein